MEENSNRGSPSRDQPGPNQDPSTLPPPPIPPDLVTIEDAARILTVAERTIRNWIDDRKLRSYKVGGAVRISRRDLARMVEVRPAIEGP